MFDLHVHTAPDVVDRIGDDLDIVRGYERAGFSGCVLKAHYDNTAGRAHVASRSTALRVYGGLALNSQVGGVNPNAVAAALDMGARVIWMPTADSLTQYTADLPRLCGRHTMLPTTTYAIPPVDWSAAGATVQILRLIAAADAVLATGHLGAAEIAWLLPEARQAGVTRLLLTHPSYTVPNLPARDVAQLVAEYGALAEVTAYQLFHQPGMSAAALAAFVASVGYEHVVLSSDAGQPTAPPPPEALAALIDALDREGLDGAALVDCASDRPDLLITPR